MSEYKVYFRNMDAATEMLRYMAPQLTNAQNAVNQVKRSLTMQIRQRERIDSRLTMAANKLNQQRSSMNRLVSVSQNAYTRYIATERQTMAYMNVNGISVVNPTPPTYNGDMKEPDGTSVWQWKGWSKVWQGLSSFGVVGTGVGFLGSLLTGGLSNSDPVKRLLDAAKNGSKLVDKVASTSSFDWKSLFGFTSNITKDTPKGFWGNLTEQVNKLKWSNAKTVGQKVSVGAKWAGHVFTGLSEFYENVVVNEEGNSTGRAIAETVGETAFKIGEGWAISAAITAGCVAAGVAAPAVVVAGVTVGVTWGLDALSNAFLGKDLDEAVVDGALWAGEKIGDALDTGAKAVGKALDAGAKAVGNAVQSAGKAVSSWWNRLTGKKAFA